jgi:hypothetical protein
LREAYLQLIETYETWGNREYRTKGRVAARAFYDKAQSVIEEALRHPELRHLAPDSSYVDEMIDHFAAVRARIFGKFRVDHLEPAHAVVQLDGRILGVVPGETRIGDDDLAVGPHQVLVQADGYKEYRETIDISPNETTGRHYTLQKKRGPLWYAGWGAGAAAVVVGGALVLTAGDEPASTAPQPLPGPPNPPSRP